SARNHSLFSSVRTGMRASVHATVPSDFSQSGVQTIYPARPNDQSTGHCAPACQPSCDSSCTQNYQFDIVVPQNDDCMIPCSQSCQSSCEQQNHAKYECQMLE
ncbi:hypothetical protein COOONC_23371, partial [Cooperia oncophora]